MSSSPLEVAAKIGMLVKLHVDNGVDKGEYTYWVCLYYWFMTVISCQQIKGRLYCFYFFTFALTFTLYIQIN